MEKTAGTPNQALAQEISREHASVREAVRKLREEIERLRAEPGPAHAPGRLGGMLVMFRVHLARHFALEEQGRFLGGNGDRDPSARRKTESLIVDHRRFEKNITSLLDAAQHAQSGDADLTDEFSESLSRFLDELERHERAENRLAQELVNRDVGAGD